VFFIIFILSLLLSYPKMLAFLLSCFGTLCASVLTLLFLLDWLVKPKFPEFKANGKVIIITGTAINIGDYCLMNSGPQSVVSGIPF
jgi:hypothetical protein